MRKVKFKKAGAKNFCCYIEPIEIEFNDNQLVLISGPNGVGKSTLFDIIPFTFYGVTTKGSRADDVMNTTIAKNCKTWVEFDVDNIEYIAERFHKYSKVGSTVILKEKRNGKFVDIGSGHREVKPLIENLITPEKLFMNTLLFGQKVKTFFTDLTDSQQKEIFRKILTLDDYVVYSKISTEELNEAAKQIISIENKINTNEALIEEMKSTISRYLEEKRQFYELKQKDLEVCQLDYKKKEDEISILKESIEEYHKLDLPLQMSENSEKINQVQAKLSTIDSDMETKINGVRSKSMLKISEINASYDKKRSEANDNLADALAKVDKLLNEEEKSYIMKINDVRSMINEKRLKAVTNGDRISVMQEQTKDFSAAILDGKVSVCPTCRQEIDEKTVNELKVLLSEIEEKIKDLQQENAQLDAEVGVLNDELDKLNNEVADIKARSSNDARNHRRAHDDAISEAKKKLEELTDKINELTVEAIDKIREQSEDEKFALNQKLVDLREHAADLQTKIDHISALERRLVGFESDLRGIENVIKSIEKREYDETGLNGAIGKEKTLSEEIVNLRASLELAKSDIKILEFWKGAFSSAGIPSMLIDESIPFMNKRIGHYLERIAGGRYIVSFDTLKATKAGEMRDKISVNVLDTKTKANSRLQFSGGQTRLVDIATILTLGDLQSRIHNMQFNILLFDEIFDALDDDNISYVSKLLRSLVSEDKSIFIISHRHIDQIDADENLRFM